jgi:1-acyl-sn-glycerol-3-phosphate acyltransferase
MKWQSLGSELPRTRNPLTRLIGRSVFSLLGWRIQGTFPNCHKLVVALVPHSSNMDFILTIAVLWGLGLRSAFLMKQSLFWFPLGSVLRALGGIPVDRVGPHGLVAQMTDEFGRRSKLVLGITPAGTRGGAGTFKQGFARIACAANVPVLPAVLDYRRRTVRFSHLISDVSDVDETLRRVREEAASGVARG